MVSKNELQAKVAQWTKFKDSTVESVQSETACIYKLEKKKEKMFWETTQSEFEFYNMNTSAFFVFFEKFHHLANKTFAKFLYYQSYELFYS